MRALVPDHHGPEAVLAILLVDKLIAPLVLPFLVPWTVGDFYPLTQGLSPNPRTQVLSLLHFSEEKTEAQRCSDVPKQMGSQAGIETGGLAAVLLSTTALPRGLSRVPSFLAEV